MPFLVDLMDLPRKKQVVEVLRNAQGQSSPEQAMEAAKKELQHDLKARELDLREREIAATEKLKSAQTVQTGVQASYSAMQAGAQVAQMPAIAPVADVIMQRAGYQKPDPMGDDPDFVTPAGPGGGPLPAGGGPLPAGGGAGAALDVRANTSPAFPPVPQQPEQPEQGMTGIETPTTSDNL